MSTNNNRPWAEIQIDKLEQSFEKLNLPFEWTLVRAKNDDQIRELFQKRHIADEALDDTLTYVQEYQKFEKERRAAVQQQDFKAPASLFDQLSTKIQQLELRDQPAFTVQELKRVVENAVAKEVEKAFKPNKIDLSESPSSLGRRTIELLNCSHDIKKFYDNGEGECIEVPSFTTEAELSKFLFKTLEDMFAQKDSNGPRICIVNSENFPWLCTRETDFALKPDFFACHPALLLKKTPKKSNKKITYGVPVSFKLKDGVYFVVETKLKSNSGIGQLIQYLQHLSAHIDSSGHLEYRDIFTYGLLLDGEEFLLMKFHKVVVEMIQGKLSQPGSKQFIKDYLINQRSPCWSTEIDDMLKSLDVEIDGDNSFLGMGTFGRVFKVKKLNEDIKYALKIADNKDSLQREYEIIKNNQGKKFLVSVVEDSFRSMKTCACYLIKEVGVNATVDDQNERKAAIKSLNHLHQQGIVHGDARVANLILHRGSRSTDNPRGLLWIDLMSTIVSGSQALSNDMRKLIHSVYGNISFTPELETLITEYGKNFSSCETIITQIEELFKVQKSCKQCHDKVGNNSCTRKLCRVCCRDKTCGVHNPTLKDPFSAVEVNDLISVQVPDNNNKNAWYKGKISQKNYTNKTVEVVWSNLDQPEWLDLTQNVWKRYGD